MGGGNCPTGGGGGRTAGTGGPFMNGLEGIAAGIGPFARAPLARVGGPLANKVCGLIL